MSVQPILSSSSRKLSIRANDLLVVALDPVYPSFVFARLSASMRPKCLGAEHMTNVLALFVHRVQANKRLATKKEWQPRGEDVDWCGSVSLSQGEPSQIIDPKGLRPFGGSPVKKDRSKTLYHLQRVILDIWIIKSLHDINIKRER